MIRVDIIDFYVGVCEAHDINSVFNTRNFTRFCKRLQNENNGQERKGRRRVEEWLIAGHQTKWEPETVSCQNYYRFILYLLPWDLPHIHPLWAEQKTGGEIWKSMGTKSKVKRCERISKRGLQRWVRDGGAESERAGSEEKTATSAGSYLDQPFVLWKEPCAPGCTSALRMLDCNGWAALFCLSPLLILPYIFLQGTEWSDNSVYTGTEMVLSGKILLLILLI